MKYPKEKLTDCIKVVLSCSLKKECQINNHTSAIKIALRI